MKRALVVAAGVVTAALVVGGTLLFSPLLDPDLSAHPEPLTSYPEASARIQAVLDAEAAMDLIPAGHSIALLTGARTENVVVLFHGFTSAPAQFRLIAQAYRDQGYNVWVPRLPYHGQTNRLTDDPSKLTAESLRDFADDAIDVAAGLGDHITVVGLSAGGSLALWSAVARPEVTRAVLISPLLLPLGYQEWQQPVIVRALRLSPVDSYAWWDPALKDGGPHQYNYSRYSLKGMAALLGLNHWAASAPSVSRASVVLVRNDADPLLDPDYNESFLTRLVSADRLTVVRIPASEGLGHDLVCPDPLGEDYANINTAYRYLEQALGIPLPAPRA